MTTTNCRNFVERLCVPSSYISRRGFALATQFFERGFEHLVSSCSNSGSLELSIGTHPGCQYRVR